MNTVLLITAIASGIVGVSFGGWLWSHAAEHRDREVPDHERIGRLAWGMIGWLLTDGLFQFFAELGKLPETVRAASELWRSKPSYRTTFYWFLIAVVVALITALSLF